MKKEGSCYADYSLIAPHDTRTQRSKRFEGLALGTDGFLCKMEQKGPPDWITFVERFEVHKCGLIMADMVSPPRIAEFLKMLTTLNNRYPECWPLLYQQIDRWMHEEMTELMRKESGTYEWKVKKGKDVWSHEESSFDPDYPFDHLFWLSVHSNYATN